MEDLDNHRYKLQESLNDMIRLRQLVSTKDSIIKDLRASKRSVVQELEAARLAVKAAEDTSATLRARRDRAMDKAIRAGRILMRRPGVTVPDDIVADVNAAPDSSSRPSSSVAFEKKHYQVETLNALCMRLVCSNVLSESVFSTGCHYYFPVVRIQQ
jgi:hypothetical protein